MTSSVGRMKIGEVHTLLRQEYPDIELSKIRYYEDKGLVQPTRSRKGYRLYSERDVECLREAIRLAQEEFVPLRVVRQRLMEKGLLSDGPSPATRQVARDASTNAVSIVAPITPIGIASQRPNLTMVENEPVEPLPDVDPDVIPQSFTTQEFLRAVKLNDQSINHLISLGLLTPTAETGETQFSRLDYRVAQCAAPLVARGVDPRLLGSIRRVVEREVGVIEDLTEPLRSPASRLSAEQARRIVGAVTDEVEALRAILLERAVGEHLVQ